MKRGYRHQLNVIFISFSCKVMMPYGFQDSENTDENIIQSNKKEYIF